MSRNLFVIMLWGFCLTACQVNSINDSADDYWDERQKKPEKKIRLIDAKYSLAKDRAELDKLRASIPAGVKTQNDEKAFLADLMSEIKYPPEVVRNKFSNLVRKKRDLFNRDMTRAREYFNKIEKKTRDAFTKELAEERESFLKKKVDRDKRADFFNEQDEARRTFMAEQKEKRDDFEADFREKRKNFEDYMKEKNDDFLFEFREYQAKWNDKLEMLKLEKDLRK